MNTLFHHQMKHLEVRQKYSAACRIFNSLLSVSPVDETSCLLSMLDILHPSHSATQWLLNYDNIFFFHFYCNCYFVFKLPQPLLELHFNNLKLMSVMLNFHQGSTSWNNDVTSSRYGCNAKLCLHLVMTASSCKSLLLPIAILHSTVTVV